jgi:hypothetical protein
MKKHFPALMLILLVGCNSNQKKPDSNQDKKDSLPASNNGQTSKPGTAVFSLTAFNKNDVPMKDTLKGGIVDGASWTDAEGDHMVVLTQTTQRMVSEKQDQHIRAYCFKKENGAWKPSWQVQDGIADCEVDATCEFFPGSLTATDNDNNNIGEVTFLYKLSCKGDVSPDDKKLIMYQGTQKYAIRGETIIELDGKKYGGGKTPDPAISNAPKALLDYANRQWDKFGFTKY